MEEQKIKIDPPQPNEKVKVIETDAVNQVISEEL